MQQLPDLDDRKSVILRAIVSHYVRSGEPVGSKTLVDSYKLNVSPATVRNEMVALEEAGYIYQPHTSAGRIPTDAGYRFFVDMWGRNVKLPAEQARQVQRFLGEPRWELEDSLQKTATLLSTLTHQAAVVFAPALDRSVVKRVELVRLAGNRAMTLLVTDTGRVENNIVLIPEDLDDVQLDQTAEMLNRLVDGTPLEQTPAKIRENLDSFPLEFRDAVKTVANGLDTELGTTESERMFLEGASNIVDEHSFADLETVRQVIETLEHRRLLLEVLADALGYETVHVKIGSENSAEEMQYCSVITAPYGWDDNIVGSLAVVGPTRMDYRRTIAAVNEVAFALGRLLTDLGA
jgi:heat-inducible transcriptional repressor